MRPLLKLTDLEALENELLSGSKYALVDEVESAIVEFAKNREELSEEKEGYFIIDIESYLWTCQNS